VPANGRSTIWVDDEQIPAGSGIKPLDNVAVSTLVRRLGKLGGADKILRDFGIESAPFAVREVSVGRVSRQTSVI
jgi:hypothetical protein